MAWSIFHHKKCIVLTALRSGCEAERFSTKVRRSFVEPENKQLSVLRQCELLGINRSNLYYRERPERFEDAELMRLNGRAIYKNSVLRLPADDDLFAEFGIPGKSQTGFTLNEEIRLRGDLPKA